MDSVFVNCLFAQSELFLLPDGTAAMTVSDLLKGLFVLVSLRCFFLFLSHFLLTPFTLDSSLSVIIIKHKLH